MSTNIDPGFKKIALSLKKVANAVILSEAGADETAHKAAIEAINMADAALETCKGNVIDMVEFRTDLIFTFLI